jgi:hypothetical protein
LLAVLAALLVLQGLFIGLVVLHASTNTDGLWLQRAVLWLLQFPFQNELTAISATLTSVLQVAVASVCFVFTVDRSAKQPVYAVTDVLNRTGHIAFFLLIGGVGFGVAAITVSNLAANEVALMVEKSDPASLAALRSALSAVLTFQAMYFVQLLGMKK